VVSFCSAAVAPHYFALDTSPLLPRLLNPESIKDTIARGVSNGQLAYVGKIAGGKYHPFYFERTINTAEVEISDEMFIITKETAEAFRKDAARPAGAAPSLFSTGGSEVEALPETKANEPGPTPVLTERTVAPASQKSGLTWSGEIPSQKWMNFYTKVLTKLGIGSGLTITVKVECAPESGVSPQKADEIRSALRELGLNDKVE
jgi:hypothetical protein